jgi:hypothetical protein
MRGAGTCDAVYYIEPPSPLCRKGSAPPSQNIYRFWLTVGGGLETLMFVLIQDFSNSCSK